MFGGGKRDDEALRDGIALLHKELRLKTHEALQHHRDTLGAELKRLQDLVGQVRAEVSAAHRDLVELAVKTEAAHDLMRRLEEAREAREAHHVPPPPEPQPLAGRAERTGAPPGAAWEAEEAQEGGAGGPGGEAGGTGHVGLLRAAAGVSAATLVCHRDTWAFLVEQAGQEPHFRVPGRVRAGEGADEGMVEVSVSGPSLIAAVTVLARIRDDSGDPGSRALAWQLYERIAAELGNAGPCPGPGAVAEPGPRPDAGPAAGAAAPGTGPNDPWPEVIRIVIDDRPH
ncbi:hypothetical protein [Streptomyces eurocidicus]|uniref:Uncharacterized protein n=1 Tax=Streptomyces eurocidicus TaxID=66423 RepID=A0A7W8BEZ0_STREU|nr:hypothetical protein [Streptomyces eurocidicus]MBB5121031.1 hypothetical protein [Streptomyces eurocidicus]MBF6055756.1 hypothetical protein [Streptomyces eurocidicus]